MRTYNKLTVSVAVAAALAFSPLADAHTIALVVACNPGGPDAISQMPAVSQGSPSTATAVCPSGTYPAVAGLDGSQALLGAIGAAAAVGGGLALTSGGGSSPASSAGQPALPGSGSGSGSNSVPSSGGSSGSGNTSGFPGTSGSGSSGATESNNGTGSLPAGSAPDGSQGGFGYSHGYGRSSGNVGSSSGSTGTPQRGDGNGGHGDGNIPSSGNTTGSSGGQTYPVSSHQIAGFPSPEISPSKLSNYQYSTSGPGSNGSGNGSNASTSNGSANRGNGAGSGFLGNLLHSAGQAVQQVGQQLVGGVLPISQPTSGTVAPGPQIAEVTDQPAPGISTYREHHDFMSREQWPYLVSARLEKRGLTPVGGAASDLFGDGMDMHLISHVRACEAQTALRYNRGYGYPPLLAVLLRQRALALLVSSETARAEALIKQSQAEHASCVASTLNQPPPPPGTLSFTPVQEQSISCSWPRPDTGFYTKDLYTFVGPDFYARLVGKPQIDGFASNDLCLSPSGECLVKSSAHEAPPGDTYHTTGNPPPGDNATAIVVMNLPYPQRLKCGDATRMSVVVNGTSIQAQGQVDEGGQWAGLESPVRLTSKTPLTTSEACTKLEGVYQKFQACGNYGIAQSMSPT